MAKPTKSTALATTAHSAAPTAMLTKEAAAALLQSRAFSISKDFKFETEGQSFHGIFLGAGAKIRMESKEKKNADGTPVIDDISTWKFRDPAGQVTWLVMGSAGLDKYIGSLSVNDEALIVYNGKMDIKGGQRRMNDFTVAVLS